MSEQPEQIRLGLVAVSSPLEVGAGDAPALLAALGDIFVQAGCERLLTFCSTQPVSDPVSAVAAGRYFYDQRVDAICVVAASWYEDYLVLDLLEECQVPLITWARPGMETGSLCGMQQLCFVLKALGHPYLFLFDELASASARARALDFALAASLRRRLRRARIGYLGHRVEGMTETTPHELALKRVFGARVVGLDTQVFVQRAAQVSPDSVADDWQRIKRQVGRITSAEEAGIDSLQVQRVMAETFREHGLSAVAVGCYPHLMGRVCLAASLLGEQGLPVGCEGDVNGALGMLMLTHLTGAPVHNTDLLDPLPADNAIVFSHCGSGGFSLAPSREAITLGPVRLMNCGLCVLFVAKPGPVTLINLVPTLDSYRLAILYGEAIEGDMVFPGNPLWVRFAPDYREVLEWIAAQGLGHHWMAAYGDLRRPLQDFAAMVGCQTTSMG